MTETLNFTEALNYRRSVRNYNKNEEINTQIVKKCIEQATLAPNSSNMQLWEFHHIVSPEILQNLSKACLSQSAATTAKQMVVIVVRKDLWKNRVKTHLNYLTNLFGKKNRNEYSSREKFALSYYKKIIPFVYADFLGILGYTKYFISYITGLFKPTYRQLRKSDIRVVAHKSAGLAAQTFMLAMAANKYDTCPMEGFDSVLVKKALNLPSKVEINMVISCGIRVSEGIYGDRFRVPFETVYKQW